MTLRELCLLLSGKLWLLNELFGVFGEALGRKPRKRQGNQTSGKAPAPEIQARAAKAKMKAIVSALDQVTFRAPGKSQLGSAQLGR